MNSRLVEVHVGLINLPVRTQNTIRKPIEFSRQNATKIRESLAFHSYVQIEFL